MAQLPDVPIDVWTGYIQDQFTEKTNGLMDALEFRVKTSPFGEMFPAVSPQDNPMLSTYEDQLHEDAAEQERRREEEMQRLLREQEFLTLRQEQAQLMQRLAPPEPTPLDPGPPAQPGSPYPDTQANPEVNDLFYRGAPPTDGEVPGVVNPIYRGPIDQPPPDMMLKDRGAQPQQVPPPMFEAPTPVQGQSFSDYAGQLRQMLGGERNSSYAAPPEPEPIEQNPVAPDEPTPVGISPGTPRPIDNPDGSVTTERSITVTEEGLNGGKPTNIPTVWNGQVVSDDEAIDNAIKSGVSFPSFNSIPEAVSAAEQRSNDLGAGRATSIGGASVDQPASLQNFSGAFNQEFAQPQDRPQDPVSSKFWEPVTNVTEKMASKSHEIGLGDAWAAATAATDPAEKANLTRIAIGKTLQMVPDAVSEAAASPLIAAMGERETNPLAKANPLATGRVGDLPGAEAVPAAQLLRYVEIPGLKGVGSAIGVEDDARYLPTDVAVNIANGPGRALEIAQWLGVAGQALEHPDSPATALLGIPAAGLAARYGLKGLGKLADSSIDPLDATRTSVVSDVAAPTDRYYHGTADEFGRPDPTKFDPEGLAGDVYYLTDEPRVAGGVVGPVRQETVENVRRNIETTRKDLEEISAPGWTPSFPQRGGQEQWIKYYQDELARLEGQLEDVQGTGFVQSPGYAQARGFSETGDASRAIGANVRPVDVPRDLRLLDMDAPVPPGLVDQLKKSIPDDGTLDLFEYNVNDANPITASQLYEMLPDNKAAINRAFQDAGYDGVRYGGGRRTPMRDEADNPITHNVLGIFPDALDKIRNATAGTPGGIIPANVPDTALAQTTKYGMSAAQGAVSGGLAAAEEDDADLGDISRGAALGAARGLGGRALRGTGAQGAWSANIAKSEWKASWKPLYADQPRTPIENRPETIQGKAWEKFNQARDYLSERFFDNRTYVNKLQGEARRYLGRDLTYDEMLSEHTRRNTSQAAQVSIDQSLRPAVQRVGPDIDYFKDAMTYRDNIAVSNAKARQVYAQEAARKTPQVQAAEREVRRLENMQNSPNAPMDLHTRLDEARTRLDEELHIREGEAWQTGGMAGEGRSFSGDVDVRESQRRLAEIEQVVGPERWANLQSAMDDTQKFVEEYRQRMYDHGIINKKTLEALQQFDFYIPTRILDHINDESKVAVGGSVSLRDTGIHEASIKGTTAEREDPINSLMRLAFDSEARIAKNDAFNAFHALNAETPVFKAKRVEGTDARAKLTDEGSRSRIVTGFVDGKKLAYEVSDPWTAKALRFESDPVSNRWEAQALRKLASVSREMITRNPAFIAGQVLLDVSGALVRESAWEGGPQNVPKVLKALMQTYFDPELWKGLDSGQYKGDYARFLREGGGMAGFQDMTQKGLLRKQEDLQRNNPLDGFQVNNKEDWGRVVKWLGTGEALQNISTRLDLAPRVAAARLAEERLGKQGVDPNSAKLRGMIAGRESTMDFGKGGSLTKMLNQFIPFFNIGFQSAATPVRALRENPVAFPATAAATIGVPIMAAEAWNRSDPQRARDYEDIPDYIKMRNLVVMMPEIPGTDIGKTGVDEFGGRRPKYIQFPLREFAMFGVLGRAAAQKAIQAGGGDVRDPMSWHQLGKELLISGSPLTANNPTDLTTSFAPVGLSSALQLANNKDAFRGRQIATERNDMEASNISKALSNGLFDRFGVEIRPSQLEFLVRDSMSYTGAGALAAGDALTGRTRPTQEGAQGAPVIGGAIKRFYGNATGQGLTDARENQLTGDTVKTLRQFGLRSDQIAPVPATLQGMPLSRSEQTAWQSAFNDQFEVELNNMMQSSLWDASDADHAELIRKAAATARARTGKMLLDDISYSERQDRMAKGAK